MTLEHVDVLIAGAGLSGIGAGYHLQTQCPGKRYLILEGRDGIGGTWDLFRYPGIRSDSDMYTLGYSFRPWTKPKSIADGSTILDYVRETASVYGIDQHIRFHHRVVSASWSTADSRWTVSAVRTDTGETLQFTCNFLFMCAGYYKYAQGYTPSFAGSESFSGQIVHPQKWTPDIDCAGKRVVVIGSGATAVTLVPTLATTAAHVTMLQRSPTYVVSRPANDPIALWLMRHLPAMLAYRMARWKNVMLGMLFYKLSKRNPARMKQRFVDGVRAALGPDYDVEKHFSPRYNPWDQRVCLVPDGDLFQAIKQGSVTVVTDQIDRFTPQGIRLQSGIELPADVIVTATGLELELLGGISVTVDGKPVDFSKTMNYKGMMYSDVPNMASSFGYTNASWTLKCDLTCLYVCRLLNHMDATGNRQCTPRRTDPTITEQPWVDFSSGYIQRSLAKFPKQGSKAPWRLHQNYAKDLLMLKFGKVTDSGMVFSKP